MVKPAKKTKSKKGDVHVMPMDKEHESSSECWCKPTIEYDDEFTKYKVWLHKEIQ